MRTGYEHHDTGPVAFKNLDIGEFFTGTGKSKIKRDWRVPPTEEDYAAEKKIDVRDCMGSIFVKYSETSALSVNPTPSAYDFPKPNDANQDFSPDYEVVRVYPFDVRDGVVMFSNVPLMHKRIA